MIITHERRFLDLIERILSKLDEESSKQVEIEAKFLEVQEGALDEISFDWQYSWGNASPLYDPKLMPSTDSKGRFPEAMKGFVRQYSNIGKCSLSHRHIQRYCHKHA